MRREVFTIAILLSLLAAAPTQAEGPGGHRGDRLDFMGFAPAAGRALAQSDHDRAKAALRAGQIRPLKQILASVRRNYRGRQLQVNLSEQGGGAWIYHVKWMTPESNVLSIVVDARTAQIMSVSGRGAEAARRR